MKKILQKTPFLFLLLMSAVPVFAETGAREDNSMTLVYFFLATCGLIIFLQLIPVFTLIYGFIKGALSSSEKEAKPAPLKYR